MKKTSRPADEKRSQDAVEGATPPPVDSQAGGGSEARQEVSPQFTPKPDQSPEWQREYLASFLSVTSCPATHATGPCIRTDEHVWHRNAAHTKWDDGVPFAPAKNSPTEDSGGAAVAKPPVSMLSAEQINALPGMVVAVDPGAADDVAVLVAHGGGKPVRIVNIGDATEKLPTLDPEIAEALRAQDIAQIAPPDVSASVAPKGTVRAVFTGGAASQLSETVAEELKRLLAVGPKLKLVSKPDEVPVNVCSTCDAKLVGFDPSHTCTRDDLLRKLKPKSLHEALTQKVRFSGRYRLCVWRDAEGQYRLAEELVDEGGTIIAFNVLDGGEGWGYMGARILDLVVDKFTP